MRLESDRSNAIGAVLLPKACLPAWLEVAQLCRTSVALSTIAISGLSVAQRLFVVQPTTGACLQCLDAMAEKGERQRAREPVVSFFRGADCKGNEMNGLRLGDSL